VLSFSVLLAGGLAALMFSRARIVVEQGNLPAPNLHPQARDIFRLWAIYCLAASGGLMVIVHAVGLMRGFGASEISIMAAPTLNAVGNIAGSLLGGVIADRLTARRALAVPLLISLISLVVMRVVSSEVALLGLMTACGFGYGALIAIVPVVIRKMFDPVHVGWVFGRVFTAWGIAGLVGPYVAGNIFDHTHGYELAIIASICCLACAAGLNMFDNSRTHQETKDRELDK
jgi:OFA family oxalate/formate antiporter-like MFS transporter